MLAVFIFNSEGPKNSDMEEGADAIVAYFPTEKKVNDTNSNVIIDWLIDWLIDRSIDKR